MQGNGLLINRENYPNSNGDYIPSKMQQYSCCIILGKSFSDVIFSDYELLTNLYMGLKKNKYLERNLYLQRLTR